MSDLAKRAVACRHWRWMPGMLTTNGWRVIDATSDDSVSFARNDFVCLGGDFENMPDLTDPATLGCLLALVREAWKSRAAYATEAEALVAALEAAP